MQCADYRLFADSCGLATVAASRSAQEPVARPVNVRNGDNVPPLRRNPARLFTGVSAVLTCANAGAGTAPLYHLQLLDVPDSTAVQVKDINDAGVIVGSGSDQDFVRHAAFRDAGGMHELALPAGVDVDGIAYAINNLGQVVGTASDFVNPTAGIAWDITAPTTYTTSRRAGLQ